MIFEGTILITDPAYFCKPKDWCSEGGMDGMRCIINPNLGFSKYIWIPTGFGDTTGVILNNEKGEIGNFGVDSGAYGVFYLSEVESYNPGITKYFQDHSNLGTIIEDYAGNIGVIKKNTETCTINCLAGSNFFAAP